MSLAPAEPRPGEESIQQYFALARERYALMLRRRAGEPPPWTEDPVLRRYRFTCVHREDDRTTAWFRRALREPLRAEGWALVVATVAFRWFNRVEAGERLLHLLARGEWDEERALGLLRGLKRTVTGAYIILGVRGLPKREGVCRAVSEWLRLARERGLAEALRGATLQQAHALMAEGYPYMGGFMAYEVVTDLRHTDLLRPVDAGVWAHFGPGARRGLGLLLHGHEARYTGSRASQEEASLEARSLLQRSRDSEAWPYQEAPWEAREVEHWLCEYSKYRHAAAGRRLKRRFP